MVELSIGDAILVVLAGETQQLAFYEDWREWPRTHHPALNNKGGKSPWAWPSAWQSTLFTASWTDQGSMQYILA